MIILVITSNVHKCPLVELTDNYIAQVLSGDGRRKVQVKFTKGLKKGARKEIIADLGKTVEEMNKQTIGNICLKINAKTPSATMFGPTGGSDIKT